MMDHLGGEATADRTGRLAMTLPQIGRLEDRIVEVIAAIPSDVAFSTSLGLEDQALLHAIAKVGARVHVFTLDTGRLFPETLDTLAKTEERYGLRVRVLAPEARKVESLVARDGVAGFRVSVDARMACCDVRKVRPLRRGLKGAAAWITGLRREQSAGRAAVPFAAWNEDYALVKINPIADWTLPQLETYIADNDIPVNPLHARGFASIGCLPCTRAIRPGEDIRAGRWWWEQEDGKECGLHARRPVGAEAPA
jgi:phosphoadenosine phosphosulfate reductase